MATVATKPSLTIKRRFKAPPEKVFAAWTDPEKVKRWMGPGEIKPLRAESDPRIGGRFSLPVQAAAGAGRAGRRGFPAGKPGVRAGFAYVPECAAGTQSSG